MTLPESPLSKSGIIERSRIGGGTTGNTPSPAVPVDYDDIPRRAQVPAQVFYKMILFSLLMLILPLSVFFLSQRYLFHGQMTYSFVAAIVTVNVILIVYVILAYLEEDYSTPEAAIKIKNQ